MPKTRLPETECSEDVYVKVGPVTYRVELTHLLPRNDDENSRCLGDIDYAEATIRLQALLPNTMTRIVLWHEVIHAILNGAGMGEHDEGLVTALSHGIVAALQDNPWLGQPYADD